MQNVEHALAVVGGYFLIVFAWKLCREAIADRKRSAAALKVLATNRSEAGTRRIFERTTPKLPEVVAFLEEILPGLRAAAAEGDFLVGWPLIAESRYFGDPSCFRRIMLRCETLAETLGSQRADEVAFFYGNGDESDLRTVRIGAGE